MPEARPSVFIVDDHAFFRAGLRSLLAEHDFPVLGEAATGEAALPLVERRRPDVVVMDLSMPGMSGAEATRELLERVPETIVLPTGEQVESAPLLLDAFSQVNGRGTNTRTFR